MRLTNSGFKAIRIPNISDGYPTAFLYVVLLACPNISSNTSFPILNIFFIPTWKSKVGNLFDTAMQWVVGSQLHIAILCGIEYLDVR